MGLAASQGRYLSLTARLSDLVYEGQQISQQRLQLAKETQQIAEEYTEAMNNTVLQATTAEGGTQQLTYDIITNQDPFSGLCMRIVDSNGNVVVPSTGETLSVTTTDGEGNETTESFTSTSSFISAYMSDLSGDEVNEMSGWSLSEVKDYYENNYASTDSSAGLSISYEYSNLINEGERYAYDEYITDASYLQEMLESGEYTLQQVSTSEENGWEDIVWQGSSSISEVYYTADDAAAEAEYEAATKEIQKRDQILELRLEQVQTEEEAVETEIDSVKEIIDKNIENSFKTFA